MVETKITPVEEIKQNLMRMEPEFAKILPSHITSEKFIKVAISAIINMPSLLEADRRSLYGACVAAATDGLMPDGREGVIVPFKGKARWMPMITGICKKIRNSGEIATLDAIVVCEGDEYESWIDEKGAHFKFKRAATGRGKEILTFAYAITRDGALFFEEIPEEDMQKIEAAAKASDSPWKGPFKNEMRRKSALRRLAKYRLPSSSDLDTMTQTEDDLYDAPKQEPSKEVGQPNRLKDIVQAQSEPAIEFGDAPAEEKIPL